VDAQLAGKRVSWVELYLDLIFVLAVGRLAHIIEAHPQMHDVWIALGLFVTLWWTWIGFAVLYNRHGDDTRVDRLLFLAGSVPAGIAAIAIGPVSEGHVAAFASAMALTRVVLAVANRGERPIVRAYLGAAVLFVVSIWVPAPWRFVLWAIAIGTESGAVLREDREAKRRMRRDRDLSALGPVDPDERLDPHHFAERFGLFLIILLGEVVISTASAEVGDAASWAVLAAAMVLAAALWWLYFDAAAEINLKVLELSGGSPTMARAIFAAGHMLPAFSLILIASGLGLLLESDPPTGAYWLVCVGIGIYLAGTRVFIGGRGRFIAGVRVLLLIATFNLGRLHGVLSPREYVWALMAWTVMCAALATTDAEDTTERFRSSGL
jgi:low temperature requirement protein LtrA